MSLRADTLTVGFGTTSQPAVLEGLDFALEPGRFDVIVGANGVGKSTLLRALAGLLPARKGQVLLDGKPLAQMPMAARAQAIGFLPQEIQPAFQYTVEQAVALGARVAGHGHWFDREHRADAVGAVTKALELVDAVELRERPLAELSGGERRRVLIASVLAQEPKYLLLDEPAAMLDLHHQAELFRLLGRLADGGLAVACVAHDWNLAVGFAHRLTVLKDGAVLACGDPAEQMRPEVLREVYGDSFALLFDEDGRPVVVPK